MARTKPISRAVQQAVDSADAEIQRAFLAFEQVPALREEGIIALFVGSDPRARAAYEALASVAGKLPPDMGSAAWRVVVTPYARFMAIAQERYGVSPHEPPSSEPGTARLAVVVDGAVHFSLYGPPEALARAVEEYADRPLPAAPEAFEIRLRCDACGTAATLRASWVFVQPEPLGWEGVIAGRVFRCAKCGATDEYTIEDGCSAELRAAAEQHGSPFLAARAGPVGSHMMRALRARPWRRPSHAMRELREMALADRATPVASWRLYSAFCEHLEEWDAAIEAHEATLALDPGAVSTNVCLAFCLLQTDKRGQTTVAAWQALGAAVAGLPRADIPLAEERAAIVGMVVLMAQRFAELFDASGEAELSLRAEWTRPGGRRAKGAIRLTAGTDWEAVAAFLRRRDLSALRLDLGVEPGEGVDLPRELAAWRKKAGPAGN